MVKAGADTGSIVADGQQVLERGLLEAKDELRDSWRGTSEGKDD